MYLFVHINVFLIPFSSLARTIHGEIILRAYTAMNNTVNETLTRKFSAFARKRNEDNIQEKTASQMSQREGLYGTFH